MPRLAGGRLEISEPVGDSTLEFQALDERSKCACQSVRLSVRLWEALGGVVRSSTAETLLKNLRRLEL